MTTAGAAPPVLGRTIDGDRAVTIDVETLIATRLLVQANSGGGKSWLLRRLLEQTYAGVPHLVIDVEGDFHTLRERFPYVLAGREGGDCPAHPAVAAMLARRFLELGVSAVIDISELRDGDARRQQDERQRFVRDFLDELIAVAQSIRRPTLVVIDEAQKFVPQDKEARGVAYSSVCDLAARGRKRGLCMVLATLRVSDLAKTVAAECNNRLVGRTNLDIDQRRALALLGRSGAAAARELMELKPGTFFAMGPAFDVVGVERMQVGEVKTTHARAGQRAPTLTPAPDQLRKVLGQLAEIPREAEQEARDFGEARARVKQLEAELAAVKRAAPVADPKAIDRAVEKATREDRARAAAGIKGRLARMAAIEKPLAAGLQGLRELIEWTAVAQEYGPKEPRPASHVNGAAGPLEPPIVSRERPIVSRDVTIVPGERPPGAGEITGPMQRILDALVWLEAAGMRGPFSREQVSFLASYSPSTSSFKNALGALNSQSLVRYLAGGVALEEAGRALANAPPASTSAEDLQARVLARLDGPMRRCLEPILQKYPESITRAELAELACYAESTSSFKNAIGALRSLGTIDYLDRGRVVARGWLFLQHDGVPTR